MERRSAITAYMQSVVSKCFSDSSAPVHLLQFGSVPLMTFLPDGDIDLSIMSADSSIKEDWAKRLAEYLEEEQTRPDAAFRVMNVQIINAEVRTHPHTLPPHPQQHSKTSAGRTAERAIRSRSEQQPQGLPAARG